MARSKKLRSFLSLDILEDRHVPAVITVNTLSDNFVLDGKCSLRDCSTPLRVVRRSTDATGKLPVPRESYFKLNGTSIGRTFLPWSLSNLRNWSPCNPSVATRSGV